MLLLLISGFLLVFFRSGGKTYCYANFSCHANFIVLHQSFSKLKSLGRGGGGKWLQEPLPTMGESQLSSCLLLSTFEHQSSSKSYREYSQL